MGPDGVHLGWFRLRQEWTSIYSASVVADGSLAPVRQLDEPGKGNIALSFIESDLRSSANPIPQQPGFRVHIRIDELSQGHSGHGPPAARASTRCFGRRVVSVRKPSIGGRYSVINKLCFSSWQETV